MNKIEALNESLDRVKTEIYNELSFKISELKNEGEGKEYDACQFNLNGLKIICRSSKITPRKSGQFVTFWKRNLHGITEPFSESDSFDFYLINVTSGKRFGQFVFPKSELIKKSVVTSERKEGKRGFRVYPPWDKAQNKQAEKTQKWQLSYFYEIGKMTDLEKVKLLYLNPK